MRVLRERDARPAIEPGQQERTVTDRGIALLRVADAVVPHRQHVRARESMGRKDVREQALPRCVVPLERDLDDLAGPLHALDVLPARRVDVILVLRIHRRLPGERKVLPRHLGAVAPLGVLPDVVSDPLRFRLQRELTDQVRLVLERRREQEGASNDRRLEHDVPERVAVHVEDQVQTPVRTAALLRSKDQRAGRLGRGTVRPIHPRRAGSRKRERCEYHPGEEPELPSMHLLPPFVLMPLRRSGITLRPAPLGRAAF